MKLPHIILALFVFLLSQGCLKDDYSKVSSKLTLSQSISVPIGSRTSTFPAPPLLNPPLSVVITDTISFNFDNISSNRALVETMMFRVGTTNSYPAEARISVSYYNSQGVMLGSFTGSDPLQLPNPQTDQAAGTTIETYNLQDFLLSGPQIDALKGADHIIALTTLKNISLSEALLANWQKFSLTVTVGIQAQIRKEI